MFDACGDDLARFIRVRGRFHAGGESGYCTVGESFECLMQQIVHAIEIVGHRAKRHVRFCGYDAV